ncbi:hypothetical protein [Nonomuraea sp. B19D2]|uniref:hypothetical protein n=1 Tax=Nonomuraea sp. B19D2 TaxID=3159561 RepID=UPI0032DB604C
MTVKDGKRWNHNIHYHPQILGAVPCGAQHRPGPRIAAAGLARMRDLLRPGGVLAIVGLARSAMPNGLPRDLAGIVVGTLHRAEKGHWQHPSPTVWPPRD